MNAYLVWYKTNHRALAKEAGSAQWRVIAPFAGHKWKTLPAATREPFYAKSDVLKAAYKMELKEWRIRNVGESGNSINNEDGMSL